MLYSRAASVLVSLALCVSSPLSRTTTGRSQFTAVAAAAPDIANKTGAFVVAAAASTASFGSVRDLSSTANTNANTNTKMPAPAYAADPEYPGTAVERMLSVRARVKDLTRDDLNGPWESVRRRILWAGGLRDLPDAVPGKGYTGHSFNDCNHVDLTCMLERVSDNENDGSVEGIALGNQLGAGIRIASLPELGPGGSWSTCAMGCNRDPPQDVAHVQFRSRIAFKLVWVPTENFDSFVLVDDAGGELARGKPSGALPRLRERQLNYAIVQGSKYARVADAIAGIAANAEGTT